MASSRPSKAVSGAGWTLTKTDIFDESLQRHSVIFPDLQDKLSKFADLKKDNPFKSRYGKHDGPCTARLVGFWHCHLRDDAILIYNLHNRAINLVCIVSHAEIEGGRLRNVANRLQKYNTAKAA